MNRGKKRRQRRKEQLTARNAQRPAQIVQAGALQPYKHAQNSFAQAMQLRVEHQHNLFHLSELLAALPPYTSRGHGGKHRTKNRLITGRWNADRSKYVPHQGASECARRMFHRAPAWVQEDIRRIVGEEMEALA